MGFFIGILYATIIEAGKGQMLAAGAIVLGYGVIGAFIGLILSIFLSIKYKTKPNLIALINKISFVLILGFIVFFWVKYQLNESKKDNSLGANITPILHYPTTSICII